MSQTDQAKVQPALEAWWHARRTLHEPQHAEAATKALSAAAQISDPEIKMQTLCRFELMSDRRPHLEDVSSRAIIDHYNRNLGQVKLYDPTGDLKVRLAENYGFSPIVQIQASRPQPRAAIAQTHHTA